MDTRTILEFLVTELLSKVTNCDFDLVRLMLPAAILLMLAKHPQNTRAALTLAITSHLG